jgi:hypothetical protein
MKKNYSTIKNKNLDKSSFYKKLQYVCALILLVNTVNAQQSYTFTNAGQTGSVGPTQLQVNTSYTNSNLSGSVVVTGGIQSFTIQNAGNYKIEAWGAAGGTHQYSTGYPGGNGSYLSGSFTFTAGTVLKILVGQKGGDSHMATSTDWDNAAAGGGGGTYVYYAASNPLPIMAAGGGGGGGRTTDFPGATITQTANSAISPGGVGGVNGNGGGVNTTGSSYWAGGGAGWLTDGTGGYTTTQYLYTPTGTGAYGGRTPANGGSGGTRYIDSGGDEGGDGGFGGGGGGGSDNMGTGGGGGFSGGGGATGGSNNNTGGGGGSYNSGTNQLNSAATNTGHGKVVITELCNITVASITSSSINAICNGNSATLTTNAISNYSWSNGATTSSIVVSPTVNTVYSLTATSPSNCTASNAIMINVSGSVPVLTVANTASASGGICPTQTVQLTATGALTYSWSGGSIPVTNGVVFSPTSAINYTVSGVNGCGTTTAVTSVSVHPFPTVNPVVSSSTLCSGSSLTLTATGNATNYVWSGGSAPGGNGTGFVPAGSGVTTYSVIGTSALSCTALATIPATVYATPINPPTANPALICIGGSSTLSATGAANYTWTSATQTVNTANFIVTPNLGSTSYTVIKTNSSCSNTQVVTVVTNSLPTIFAIVTPTIVCALTPATLAVGGAQTYTWTSPGPPSYTFTGASPVVSPIASSVYSVAASDGTCISTTTVSLAANPNPTITATASTPTTCGGEAVTLSASGGINYSWTSSGTASSTSQSFTDAPIIPTAYYVTGDNSFGCSSGANVVVLVLPSPTITTASAKPLVCNSGSVILTAGGAGSYTWSANAGGVTTNTALVNPTNTTSGPVIFTVQGTSATNACKSTNTVLVNVFIPTLSVGGNTNTCAGGSVTLAILGGNSNYNWNTGSSSFNTQNVTASLTAPAVFTLSANTSSAGISCPSTKTVDVGIYYNPTITAVPDRTTICRFEFVDIIAGGGVTYNWNTGSTNTVLTVSPVGNIINYTVTGTDANGCSSTATVQIKISTCAGITELNSANGLNIYPNPNNGVFTIETNTAIQLNLVNELGQLVRVITLSDANNYKVSVNDLAQGIYFISGQKDTVQIYQKIVVTK